MFIPWEIKKDIDQGSAKWMPALAQAARRR
jgi:hypothetical protein